MQSFVEHKKIVIYSLAKLNFQIAFIFNSLKLFVEQNSSDKKEIEGKAFCEIGAYSYFQRTSAVKDFNIIM